MNDYAEMNEWVLTLENIIKCFQEAGYKAILKEFEDGSPYISSSSSGLTFSLHIHPEEVGKKTFKIRFLCFTGLKASLELANKINNEVLVVKVSVDDDGEAIVEWWNVIHHNSSQQLISSIEIWDTWFGEAVIQLKMGQ